MNFFIIVDSGSTTSRWVKCTSTQTIQTIKVKGINPSYQTDQEIEQIVKTLPAAFKKGVSTIEFYGSGCASQKNCIRISAILHRQFGPNCNVTVACDILGVALSLFQNHAGIAAIMGTGSNVCIYDGQKIVEDFGGMGYLIDDYGSGFDIGRRFLSQVYSHRLPRIIEEDFFATYSLSRSDMLYKIYHKETFPNRYIVKYIEKCSKYVADENICS